ncbi:hypothetical protein C6341_g319 [Phytophthora cactorum]|nr:hypothetical protein C6341_g319 [Phytophthora cactorum]
MPSQLRLKRHTPEERRRVLDAYSSGGDWRAIAHYNGFPRTTAEYLVGHGRVEDLPRGGSRANKVTPEIKEALETWMNECCTFTLRTLQNLVVEDFNVKLSQTTISRHLIDMMYTIKQADHVQQRDEQGEEEGVRRGAHSPHRQGRLGRLLRRNELQLVHQAQSRSCRLRKAPTCRFIIMLAGLAMKRKRKDRRIVAGLAMKRKRKDRRIVAGLPR